jgi:hypothetical protein
MNPVAPVTSARSEIAEVYPHRLRHTRETEQCRLLAPMARRAARSVRHRVLCLSDRPALARAVTWRAELGSRRVLDDHWTEWLLRPRSWRRIPSGLWPLPLRVLRGCSVSRRLPRKRPPLTPMTSTKRTATLRDILHGQRKHTIIVGRALHPRAANSGDDRPCRRAAL